MNYISSPTTASMYSTIPTFEESTITIIDSTDEIDDSTDDCTAESCKNCRLKVSPTMTNQVTEIYDTINMKVKYIS